MFFKDLADDQLIKKTHEAVGFETKSTTNVVRHFVEIYRRDLYLKRGFSSMYLLATEEFKYDNSSAQRRVNAMELAIVAPEILNQIDCGESCLQSAADIQKFLNFQRGKRTPYSTSQIHELVKNCSGLSTRKVQLELASRCPEIDFQESKKMISKDRMRITYTCSVATEEKLNRIKEIRSSVNPYMNREDLLDFMAEIVLDKIDSVRKDQRAENRASAKAAVEFESQIQPFEKSNSTRYIKAHDQRDVRTRNENKGCAFTDAETGRRCGSKHQMQFDHIEEYSRGGSNEATNLQIYCAKHNRFSWRQRTGSHIKAVHLAYG